MSSHAQFPRVRAFMRKLDGLDMDGQIDAFINEAIESGSSYLGPGTKGPCSHLFEISLYNIFANGAYEDEAIRNWKKAADAQMPRYVAERTAHGLRSQPADRKKAENVTL